MLTLSEAAPFITICEPTFLFTSKKKNFIIIYVLDVYTCSNCLFFLISVQAGHTHEAIDVFLAYIGEIKTTKLLNKLYGGRDEGVKNQISTFGDLDSL